MSYLDHKYQSYHLLTLLCDVFKGSLGQSKTVDTLCCTYNFMIPLKKIDR